MPALGLLTGTQRRTYGGLPDLPLTNLFAERAITEPTQFQLRSRPRLFGFPSTIEQDAVSRALHITPGGAIFGVFDRNVYFNNTLIGTNLIGWSQISIAGNQIGIVVTAAAGDAQFWDGSTLRAVSFPDGAGVQTVMESQGRFIFIRANSHRYYWTEPLANAIDGSGDLVIDGLDFASAENDEDNLVDGLVYNSMLVLGGGTTIELHAPTGNDNAPWAPLVGSTIESNVLRPGCMTLWNNTFAWISREYNINIYNGSGFETVSNEGIEEKLREFTNPLLDSFYYDGREFLRVRPMELAGTINGGTQDLPSLLLDARTGEWCEWSSDGGAFVGGPAIKSFTSLYFGQINNGRLCRFDTLGEIEDVPTYQFRAGLPIDGGTVPIHNVLLRCQTGLTGDSIEMRFSRDKGQTWSNWRSVSLANVRKKIEWRSLGMFDQPGALFEFRTVGATEFAVSGAMFNEFVQGRARG